MPSRKCNFRPLSPLSAITNRFGTSHSLKIPKLLHRLTLEDHLTRLTSDPPPLPVSNP
ncbi:hypothetical protein RchiOBHm_Chr6g0281891 [Rosa chinensis]|uniref:Uncharacterized protein n=1 Tax=Rosa chinensis TaxID=74649 RepID=A0A2P6PTN1_ROSCH|nr:hypothetical protein RchiOBHm_Chr6g0281891 [Rosa chinensis]